MASEGPPAYSQGNTASAPPAPAVQYDTNQAQAAPAQAQQPAVQYVDQNGNPIQVQQQQPAVQYVDQNGNPIQVVQQGQQPMVIVQQPPAVVQPPRFGHASCMAHCPKCNMQVATRVTHISGLGTWAICAGICCAGFGCGCCFIPFCIEDCKDIHHNCSKCGQLIHVKKFM